MEHCPPKRPEYFQENYRRLKSSLGLSVLAWIRVRDDMAVSQLRSDLGTFAQYNRDYKNAIIHKELSCNEAIKIAPTLFFTIPIGILGTALRKISMKKNKQD